jgi:type II secretory pathway predicted ATPase ExeA
MNTPTIPVPYKARLQAHFGFTGLPFRKNVAAHQMFDSQGQRELVHALHVWLEVRGLALITGPSGAGKSISLRRFLRELPQDRFATISFGQIPTTPVGFLRAMSRRLELRTRLHGVDMFDAARDCLATWSERHGVHPVLVLDDAEGMSAATLDLVRRLTAGDLDAEDRFSLLISGTEALLRTLREPTLEPLRTRFAYAHGLRAFSLDDTRNYVRFHLQQAGSRDAVFTDGAVTALFHASQGVPRAINQLALQALVNAATNGLDAIDDAQFKRVILAHPFYELGGQP